MKTLLTQLKLIEIDKILLQMGKNEFVDQFEQRVNKADIDFFADSNEQITSKNNPFKGQVSEKGFELVRRPSLGNENMNFAVATGSFRTLKNGLQITTEINGFNGVIIPISIFAIIINVIILIAVIRADEIGGEFGYMAIPLSILTMALMLGGIYSIIKMGMKKTRLALEEEINSIGAGEE